MLVGEFDFHICPCGRVGDKSRGGGVIFISHQKCKLMHVSAHHDCLLRVDGNSLNSGSNLVCHLGVKFVFPLHWGSHGRIVSAKAVQVVKLYARVCPQ